MTETKRCSGYRGVWACDYPDHMVPVEEFGVDNHSRADGMQHRCNKCRRELERPSRNAIIYEAYTSAGITRIKFRSLPPEGRKSLMIGAEVTMKNSPIKNSKVELPKIQKDPKTKSISVPRETYPKEGYVYIFQDMMKPNGVYKIGSTDDVGSRLSNARTWGEFRCVQWFYSDDCKALEKSAHNALSKFKINKDGMGDEWFQIAKDSAINKIQELSNASTTV